MCSGLLQVFICLGILAALAVGLPLEHSMHSVSLFGSSVAWWRVMLGLAIVPAAAQVRLRGRSWMCRHAGLSQLAAWLGWELP